MKIEGLMNLTSQVKSSEATGGRAASEAKRPVVEASPAISVRETEDGASYLSNAGDKDSSATQLDSAIEEMNAQFMSRNSTIRFEIDQESKEVIITVVDKASDEIIREIPPEEVVKMRARFKEMAGLLLEETV